MDEHRALLDPDEFFEASVALLGQLLGLLIAFIGEHLTLNLVNENWPNVPLHDLDFGNKDKNGKTKL